MKKAVLIGLCLLIADQVSKYAAAIYLQEEFIIIPNFLSFSLQYNSGIAFSIPLPFFVTIPLTFTFIIVLTILAYLYLPWKNRLFSLSFSCIFAGACGNFLDRLYYAQVIDFIKIGWWPVFNIADSLITVSVILFLIAEFIQNKTHYRLHHNKSKKI